MLYLPLKFESSNIFAKKIIAVRPDIHITISSGILPDKAERKSAATSPVFELSYSRKSSICGEVNTIPMKLRPGYSSLGFLEQATCHSEYDKGEEIQLYSIWVSSNAFNNFCEAVCGKNNIGFSSFQNGAYYCCDFKSDAREESIIRKLDLYFTKESDNLNKLLLESYILELMSINIEKLICEDFSKNYFNQLSKTDIESLMYAGEILLNRLESPPTLLELSRTIHMNDCKLKRSFKQYFGKTVYEFIREQRFEKAFSLLEGGEHNVSETAFAVGYTNVSHFSKTFKERFGITPRDLCK
ncbi:helix-turn-helix domain protein [Clostridium argentinense CDC 2741]|uniref:Helix-turn-helix domain protein n=1 Tax=Clostridium argentinense CDC 2741 TaxID=1418104 RepID=A0A0C1U689_9CLOT|nr:AraC family transcriptional regulator [Clostridium argentinense]ARC84822.1 AraC family transcriptional regulator [Clostridium argentinense]KIE48229.1 helix-turn-helix domain protein [Clostridium argentinense CDC 2741]NFF41137.1 helix-turn-helix transcriptional regulator [Clostridium argentinense]NFP51575.1 helix-turn-helix transcriptional regulator [Clostridium argentinense]NFP74060.1 helix-turn-helix transcriptional regulator [Clostridium argentinense]